MIAKPVVQLLADLGVTKSHNRPHVSNDYYSESQFRTFKYRPDFPDQFGSFEDAQVHCQRFMTWYNEQHVHSGIGYHTPADVHYGRAEEVRELRGAVLLDTYDLHPERFVRKVPTPAALPTVAWINEPVKEVTNSLN
jgi:putative transposase